MHPVYPCGGKESHDGYVTDQEICEAIAKMSSKLTKRRTNLFKFSFGDGVHVDFQELYRYIPTVSPIADMKYIDCFDPNLLKTEQVMIKVQDEFQYAEFSVKHFAKPNGFLLRTIAQIKSPAEVTSAFIQRQIYNMFSRFPNFNFAKKSEIDATEARSRFANRYQSVTVCSDANVALEDPCMFNFINLVIIMKYINILQKFDERTRKKILSNRKPVLDEYMKRDSIRSNTKAMEFYEWFLSLMDTYAEHNAQLFGQNQDFNCPESGYPYVLPFVGGGSKAEFFAAQRNYRVWLNDDEDETYKAEPCLMADESSDEMSTVDLSDSDLSSDFENELKFKKKVSDGSTELPSSRRKLNLDIIREESVLFNEALTRMMRTKYGDLNVKQKEYAEEMKKISYTTILEMYSLDSVMPDSAETSYHDMHEWQLVKQYIRLSKDIFCGSEPDDRIEKAKTMEELNNIRISYVAEYKRKLSEETKPGRERKKKLNSRRSSILLKTESGVTAPKKMTRRRSSSFSVVNEIPSPPPHLSFISSNDEDQAGLKKPALVLKKRRPTIFI